MTRDQQIQKATIIRKGQSTYIPTKVGDAVEVQAEHHASINAAKRRVREVLKAKGGHAVALKTGETYNAG